MGLYKKIDDAIMTGVNSGVRAWNWTTGRTKKDLAHSLLTLAPVCDSLACVTDVPSSLSYLCIVPTTFLLSHSSQELNEKIEDREVRALESGSRDFQAEMCKNITAKYLAYLNMCVAGAETYVTTDLENFGFLFGSVITFASGLRSTAFFVMRADYLPPRKNVLSRASDKIKEMIRSREQQPEGALAPVYGRATIDNLLT